MRPAPALCTMRRLSLAIAIAVTAIVGGGMAYAPAADARVVPYSRGHYIRHVRLQGTEQGTYRTGLWVMERSTGRVRLCVVQGGPGTKIPAGDTVDCSPWAGGSDQPGRYQITDIRSQVSLGTGRRVWTIIGVWVLNYASGEVRACLIQDMNRPAASLKCSPFK